MKRIIIGIIAVYLAALFGFHIAAFAQGASAAEILFEAGKEYYEMGNYREALREFKKVLMLEPEHEQTLIYIGLIEEELFPPEEWEEEQAWPPAEEVVREQAINRALGQAEEKMFAEEETEPEPIIDIEQVIEEQEETPEEVTFEETPEPAQRTEPAEVTEEPYQLLQPGKTFIECYNKYYWHDTHFDGDGERIRWAYNGRSREVITELKFEHGLTENLTLLGSIPYKTALWKDDYKRNTTSGVGDIWMRLKYNIWDQASSPFTFYLQPGLRVPGGYDDSEVPSLGTGEVAGELRFLGVRSFSNLPCYSKIETGYRYRADEYTDEIPYFFELGFHPFDWFLFKTTIDGIEGLSGTGDSEEDWTKWTVHTIFSPQGGFGTFRAEDILNFEFSYGNTFAGKNTSNGTEAVVNITYQF